MTKSKIYIKPSKRGTFTAAANKRGKGVQEFASQVLANPDNYSGAMRKKAQFAKNATQFKHVEGGYVPEYGLGGDIFAGAVSGGSSGASLGPWGAVGGAVLGGLAGLIGGKKKQAAEEEAKRLQQENIVRQQRLAELEPDQQYQSVFPNGGLVDGVQYTTTPRYTPITEQTYYHEAKKLGLLPKDLKKSEFNKNISKYKNISLEKDLFPAYKYDDNLGKFLKKYEQIQASKQDLDNLKARGSKLPKGVQVVGPGKITTRFPGGGTVPAVVPATNRIAGALTTPTYTALDKRIAETIAPRGYSDDPEVMMEAAKNFFTGAKRSSTGDLREELWRYSLGSPEELKHLEKTQGDSLRIKNLDKPQTVSRILKELNKAQADTLGTRSFLPLTEVNSGLVPTDREYQPEAFMTTDALGNYRINKGQDERGNFVEYYDKWDLANPLANAYLDRRPEVTDKIYYEDNPARKQYLELSSALSELESKMAKATTSGKDTKELNVQYNAAKKALEEYTASTEDVDIQREYNILEEEFKYGGMVKNKYPLGGMLPYDEGQLIEAEGGESGVAPGGTQFNINGPSHAGGGVKMEAAPGTRIYSDRIKVPGSDMTFSDANKKLASKITKYQDIIDDRSSTRRARKTAERMLERVAKSQDELFQQQQTLNGNSHGKGNIPKANDGILVKANPMGIDPNAFTPNLTAATTAASQTLATPTAQANGGFDLKGMLGGIGGAIGAAAPLLPAIYNIGQGLFGKPEVENPADYSNIAGLTAAARLRNREYNVEPQLAATNRAFATGKRNITTAARTRGELLSNLGGLSAQQAAATSNIYAQKQNIENQYDSESAQMQAQIGAQDAATRMATADRNTANRAASNNFLSTGLSQISNITQGMKSDKMKIDSLSSLLPNFIVDPNTGRIKYKPN